MKTSSAKAKGRRCATEVKEHLLRVFSELLADDVVVTSSGETGEDIKLSPKARGLFPFSIECKNVERLNIWKAIEQVDEYAKYSPIIFFRKNRSNLYVCLDAEQFLEIYHESKNKS